MLYTNIYIQVRNSILRFLDSLTKNTDFQAEIAQSVDHETAARMVAGSSPGHSLLLAENLGSEKKPVSVVNETEKNRTMLYQLLAQVW